MIKIEDGTVQAEGTPFQLSVELAILLDNMKRECGEMCVAMAMVLMNDKDLQDLTIEEKADDKN